MEIISPKIFESEDYFNNLTNSLKNNSVDNLQLYYISEVICYYAKMKPEEKIQIFEDIEKYVIEFIKYYKEKEIKNNMENEKSFNIIVPLLDLVIFIIKNNKEDLQYIFENMSVFIFIGQNVLFKNEYKHLTHEVIVKYSIIPYLL